MEYDSKSNMISYQCYDRKKNLLLRKDYRYFENGNIKKEIVYNK